MDQDQFEYDPMAPPHTQAPHTQDAEYASYDQTVPNLEAGDPRMEFEQQQQQQPYYDNFGGDEPRNFHDDLPANFAKEAAKSDNNHQHPFGDEIEGIEGSEDSQHFQSDPYRQDGDEHFQQQQQQQDFNSEFHQDFRTHDQVEYDEEPEQEQEIEQDREHEHMMEAERGDPVHGESAIANPFDHADNLLANQQPAHRNEYEDNDRPILAGYTHRYEDDSQEQQQQSPSEEMVAPQQYDDNQGGYDDDDVNENEREREELDEARFGDQNSPPDQEQYSASPPEADRYSDDRDIQEQEQFQHSDDATESQRVDDHDQYLGQGQPEAHGQECLSAGGGHGGYGSEEERGEVKMPLAQEQHGMQREEDDSDNENAGTFEYNKMEEEETTEDLSGGEDELVQNDSEAGIDNHAFDDNDDDGAEVIHRKLEKKDEVADVEDEQPESDYEPDPRQPTVCEPCIEAEDGGLTEQAPGFDPHDQNDGVEHDQYVDDSIPRQGGDDDRFEENAQAPVGFDDQSECQQSGALETAPLTAAVNDDIVTEDNFDDNADEDEMENNVPCERKETFDRFEDVEAEKEQEQLSFENEDEEDQIVKSDPHHEEMMSCEKQEEERETADHGDFVNRETVDGKDEPMDVNDERYTDDKMNDDYENDMQMNQQDVPVTERVASAHIESEQYEEESIPQEQPGDEFSNNGEEVRHDENQSLTDEMSEPVEQKPADLSVGGDEDITSEADTQPSGGVCDASDEQLEDNTCQSLNEEINTPSLNQPSSLGGDFNTMSSAKGQPPRSFVDMIDDMASPETIPQPLPSPPQPNSDSMSQFDPLATPDDEQEENDFIMGKQQLIQEDYIQENQIEQHAPSSELEDGLYYDNQDQVTPDGREESSDDLCLRAGEFEGETTFGVDGSAVTTSAADKPISNAFMGSEEEEDESQSNQSQPQSSDLDVGFQQQDDQQSHEREEDDIEDSVNAGVAGEYTTTTTTTEETEEKSGADGDTSSLGQVGFESETGVVDNALMSMSMEGSFYDDGSGDIMGGADGMNGTTENNLLIQSAITEVSEPTSSFSPHQDSVLRAEQQAFEEKLSEQNSAPEDAMFSHENQPAAVEDDFGQGMVSGHTDDEPVEVQTTHESHASIPSGFEEDPCLAPSSVNDLAFAENDTPSSQQNTYPGDDRLQDEFAPEPSVTQNGGASEAGGMNSLLDAPIISTGLQTPETESAAPAEPTSSSVDDFGLQNQCNFGGSGFEDSSSVDNTAALMDNSSAVNGYHDSDMPEDSLMKEVESSAVEPVHVQEEQSKVEAADSAAVSSAAAVADIASQPPMSSSVDVTPAAEVKKEEKKPEPKTAKDKEKEKKDTKEKEKKPASAKPSSATTARKTPSTLTTAKKSATTATKKDDATTKPTIPTAKAARPTTTRPSRPTTTTTTAKKTTETTASPRTATSPRKPTSASTPGSDKKTSPTKPSASSPGSASKPLPRYAQPITPRKPRDPSASAPGDAAAKKPATPKTTTTKTTTTPTTPRPRPTSATTKAPSSTPTAKSSTTTSSLRPKSSPTKLSNGTTPSSATDKRSTSPTKKYGIGATRTPTSATAKAAADKKDVKASPRTASTPTGARSPTKTASPRTPSNSATPRTPSSSAKLALTKKPDYSNVTSRIGSKDKMTHKPGGGNVKIESRKVKVEAKSKVGSLDNASHKPAGGDKKVENGTN